MLPPPFLSSLSKYSSFRTQTLCVGVSGPSAGVLNANQAVFQPILIPWWYPMKRIWMFNGSVSGNADLGIYSRSGAKLVSTGSFVQAGANVMQYRSLVYLIPPGSYFFAIVFDNNSGFNMRATHSGTSAAEAGVLLQNTAFPLPAVMGTTSFSASSSYRTMGITLTESGFA